VIATYYSYFLVVFQQWC